MRRRGRFVVVALVVAVVVVLALVQKRRHAGPESEQDFLREVRSAADKVSDTEGTGSLPPLGKEEFIPQIELEPDVLELGPLSNKEKSTHEVKVFNRGRVALKIDNINTTCACTTGKMKNAVIPPGESGTLLVTIDPFRIPGFSSEKSLFVFSNDIKHNPITLDVNSRIEPEFSVEPESIDLGEVAKGTPAEGTMILRQLTDDPVTIKELRWIGSTHIADLSFSERPKESWARPDRPEFLIRAVLRQDVLPGQTKREFMLLSKCVARSPYPSYQVFAKPNAFYAVEPKELAIGSKPGVIPTATISADVPFEVVDVKSEKSLVTVSAKPGPKPNTVAIEARPSLNAAPLDSKDDAILFTVKGPDGSYPNRLPIKLPSAKKLGKEEEEE